MKHPLLMINILHAFYWFDEALQAALKASCSISLNRTQSLVLCDIAVGETRATRLARHVGISRQAMRQVLGGLQDMGIITMRPDPGDSRALLVDFSEEAGGLREAGRRALAQCERELGSRIGEANLAGLRAALAVDWGESPELTATADIAHPDKSKKRQDNG